MKIKLTVDGQDYTKHLALPLKWEDLLDERLDDAHLTLKCCVQEILTPQTAVTIELEDAHGNILTPKYVVSSDSSAELVGIPIRAYNHETTLIEETKLLEGVISDALTFTNSLGRTYTDAASPAEPIYE